MPGDVFFYFYIHISSSFPFPFVITASGVPAGTFVSMNRFSTLCG
jgi:hypothetical protein